MNEFDAKSFAHSQSKQLKFSQNYMSKSSYEECKQKVFENDFRIRK